MIKAKNLSKEYFRGDTLFQGVDFVLSDNERVGLVGPNGGGKTTLLKVILGLEEPTTGSVTIENEQFGYLPQELDLPEDLMFGEFIQKLVDTGAKKHLLDKIIFQLELSQLDEYREIKLLSGGEKMKVKLIQILSQNPTSLILDEPTNHLDIDGIIWFEKFIKNFNGNVLMISHDRSFLNNTVTKILEIENKEFHIYVGNYDNFIEQKKHFIEKKNSEYVQFLKKRKQLEDLLLLAHKLSGGKRGAVQAAKSRFEREINQNQKEKYEVKRINISLEGTVSDSKLVLKGKDLTKKFDDRVVLDNLNFELRGKQKVWLFGPNGAGKTTLVKTILSEYQPDFGEIKIGNGVRIGYFAQSNQAIDLDLTVFDYFINETALPYGKVFGVLKKFLFEKENTKKKLKSLSPGQRARLKLAVFTSKEYELLILDEPTNHLDILAKEVIEEALRNFKGALLLVSHDRYFVSEVGVDSVWELRDSKMIPLSNTS